QRHPPASLSDLPPTALEMLEAHRWPGNVRELRNTLARLVLFPQAMDQAITAPRAGGGAGVSLHLPFHEAREGVVAEFERRYVTEQLRAHGGNVSAAAKAMGVSRQFLHKLIAEHGIRES